MNDNPQSQEAQKPKKPGVAGEIAKGVIKKGVKAGIKKVGKKIASTAAVQGIKQAVASAAPGVGNAIALASDLLGKIAKKITTPIRKALSGLVNTITGTRDRRKQLAYLGGGILAAGILAGSAPLMIAGGALGVGAGAAYVSGTAIGAGIAGFGQALVYSITAVAAPAIGTPVIIALLATPLVIIFMLFIINTGAFVVPPGPPLPEGALVESPYIEVVKTPEPAGPFENNQELRIVYTITIDATLSTLSNVSFSYNCSVISETDRSCPAIGSITVGEETYSNFDELTPEIISPASGPFVISYEQLFRSGRFNDSLILDTFTINAIAESRETEAVGYASIRIGEPPDNCPSGWPVHGTLTQGAYGPYTHSYAEALDIGAGAGTPVTARHTGIARVFPDSGPYGRHVEIVSDCEGAFFSRYAHLSAIEARVTNGATVTYGQVIGLVGSTGNSTGPHLHYEFRYPSGPAGGRGDTWRSNPPYMMPPFVDKALPRECTTYAGCGNTNIP